MKIALEGSQRVRSDIAYFLFQKFHAAAQQGTDKIELAELVKEFEEYPTPFPVAVDASRLKTAFVRFGEVQREALIVPPLLNVDGSGKAMQIVDRRLFLFLSKHLARRPGGSSGWSAAARDA